MTDEALEDLEREHRYAQNALKRKRISVPTGKTLRYESTTDCSEEGMADVVWIDRLTGKEVFRYDGADPANTNSYYGAPSDEESFTNRGLDVYALISKTEAKPMPRFSVFDNYDD